MTSLYSPGTGQDVFFAYGGNEAVGYRLQEVEGVLQYFPGVVKQIVDQQHIGSYNYDALPAEVSSPLIFESWHRGAGFTYVDQQDEADSHGLAFHGYSYSRGINASYEDRLYRSFLRTAYGVVTAAAPAIYRQTREFGLFRSSGNVLYHYNTGTTTWDAVETVTSTITDIIEYGNSTDNYVVVAQGDTNVIQYSTDGTTFAGSSHAGTYLAVRGVTSTEPTLWTITADGKLRSSVAPATFSNADRIGSGSDVTTGLTAVADVLVILKDCAMYLFDGSVVKTIIEDYTFRRSTNGKQNLVWFGKVYFNFMGRIIEYDAAQDALRTVFKTGHPEINGAITAMTADATHLYFMVKNAASNTYLLNMRLGGGGDLPWHTVAYLGANDSNAISFFGPASVHATNPIMSFGYGATDKYFIHPRDGLRPEDDSVCTYDLTSGVLYSARADGGTLTFPKFFNGARTVAEHFDPTDTLLLEYNVNGTSNWDTALYIDGSNGEGHDEHAITEVRIEIDVEYITLAYRITMGSGVTTRTHRVLGINLDSMPNPPRRKMWGLAVEIGPGQGAGPRNTPAFKETFLIEATGQRATFTDYRGISHAVLVQMVTPLGYKRLLNSDARSAIAMYGLTLVEV
jgi:hypothetical protein